MNYTLIKEILDLIQEYESESRVLKETELSVDGFKRWIVLNSSKDIELLEPSWEGKEDGRSPESVINTLIVHMNRYAKSYSKAAIYGSDFSTQEDFIYLINLKAFGEMTKMELIKKNVHEKSVGMQIINRLIAQGWIAQRPSQLDKRSKIISITSKGLEALEKQMEKIRDATTIVTGNLSRSEKMELIRLLDKLNDFHLPIYEQQVDTENLLDEALTMIKNPTDEN